MLGDSRNSGATNTTNIATPAIASGFLPGKGWLQKLRPKKIDKTKAIEIIKSALPYVQNGISTLSSVAGAVPGAESVLSLIESILSYYEKEAELSDTVTSLGVLTANIGLSVSMLVANPALLPLVETLQNTLADICQLIQEEEKILRYKGVLKIIHIFSKAKSIVAEMETVQARLEQEIAALDLRIQIQDHNSIEYLTENFLLLSVSMDENFFTTHAKLDKLDDSFVALLDSLDTFNSFLLKKWKEQQAPLILSTSYIYEGTLYEEDGSVEHSHIKSADLSIPAVRKDVKDTFEPKLDNNDGFVMKIKYTDKETGKSGVVEPRNKSQLTTYLSSTSRFEVAMIVEAKSAVGYKPLVSQEAGDVKLVVKDGDEEVIVQIESQSVTTFSDVRNKINAQSDIHISEDATLGLGGTSHSASALVATIHSNSKRDINVLSPTVDLSDAGSPHAVSPHPIKFLAEESFDVMVSYCWKASKDLVKSVVARMRESGLTVWFDEDEMYGNILDRMAEAVDKSQVFCMFLNDEYQESYNCGMEYSFAVARRKPVVVARDTTGVLKAKGPLLVAGSLIYADFSAGHDFDEQVQVLSKNIAMAMKSSSTVPAVTSVNVSVDPLALWLNPVDFSEDNKKFETAYVSPTRKWMLENFIQWVTTQKTSLMCLLGGAGVGKSVFAWLVQHNPKLYSAPATFFCRHNSERKNNSKNIVSSLAFQLSEFSPEFRAHVVSNMLFDQEETAKNPDLIPLLQRRDAFKVLIIQGLHKIKCVKGCPVVLVIDALDECGKGIDSLLETIRTDCETLPSGIKLFVTSRPEGKIVKALESIHPDQMLVREQQAIQDVFIYLDSKFRQLCKDVQVQYDEPIQRAAATLADASEGVFVFAALVCKQLSEMAAKNQATWQQDLVSSVSIWSAGKHLDDIYAPFFETHFANAKDSEIKMFNGVMGVVVTAAIGVSVEAIAAFLNVPVYNVQAVILRVQSLIYLEEDKITVLHKSVKDFLTTSRCQNQHFRINIMSYHKLMARQCLELGVLEDSAGSEVKLYAILFWTEHLMHGNAVEHFSFLKKMVANDGTMLLGWYKVFLQAGGNAQSATVHLLGYFAKLKSSAVHCDQVSSVEKVFLAAFDTFGDVFLQSQWAGQFEQFLQKIKEPLTKGLVASKYDFYISFDLSNDTATAAANYLSTELGLRGFSLCLMDNKRFILNSTVYIVLLTQSYQNSRQCQANFAYAKANSIVMFGVVIEPKDQLRGESWQYLKRSFWAMGWSANKTELVAALALSPALCAINKGFQMKWPDFIRETEIQRTALNIRLGVQSRGPRTLSSELGKLMHLKTLDLHGNNLSGAIPSELGNLVNLTALYLHKNQLSGAIPSELGNLVNLTALYLHDNQLSGAIPSELGNLVNLAALDLHHNDLSGAIPSELGNLVNLTELHLQGNFLSGAIPSELGNLVNLTELSLSFNYLSVARPSELGNLVNLTQLYIVNNQLSGAILSELGNLVNLTQLFLNNNQLSGVIPSELGNLVNLAALHLTNNQLSGVIPSELGNLVNLAALYLRNNQLSGAIPSELGNLVNLKELSLSDNYLSGAIPSELGNLVNLTELCLSSNVGLKGRLPGSLSKVERLAVKETHIIVTGGLFRKLNPLNGWHIQL